MSEETAKETKQSRRKLTKEIYYENGGGVRITVLGGKKGTMDFPFSRYNKDLQTKFGPFGQGHKLGDAAAGREGEEAENAIIKVDDGLVAGEWSTKAPAVPKVKVSDLLTNFQKMTAKEKAVAGPLLAALGIKLPAA